MFSPATAYERLATVVLIAIVALIVWLIVVMAMRRMASVIARAAEAAPPPRRRRHQRALTALSLLSNAAKWVIIIGFSLWALIAIGLGAKIMPVLAGAGIVGLAIGFGAQQLVRDLISGLFIVLEGQYAVGDFVEIGPVFGQVVGVGLRVTMVRALDDRVHFIPNGTVAQVTVYDDPWLSHIADVPIADPAQGKQASELLTRVVQELEQHYPARFRSGGATEVISDGIGAIVRVWFAVLPKQDWLTGDEVVKRIVSAFSRAGIALDEGRTPRVVPAVSPRILGVEGASESPPDQVSIDQPA
ncbi:MAG: mechanosensitive ion channel family protein [Armatimonadetes bacterium]|nr:mechanosensitive ion channel family protein [Armatimonadota bacterium]